MTQAESPATARPRRAPVREFVSHVAHMPPWHRKMLVLAGALAIVGLLGQATARVARAPAADADTRMTPTDGTTAAPRAGLVSESEPPPSSAAAADRTMPEPTLRERLSPWASRVGLGFLGGFVIGWAFRAFIKTMAIVTAAGVAIIWTLGHFNVLQLDMEAAESRFKSSTSWVSTKAEQLKDNAMAVVPSSASSFFGMFLGFRRK